MRSILAGILSTILSASGFCQVGIKETILPVEKVKVSVLVGTTSAFTGIAFDVEVRDGLPEGVMVDREAFVNERNQLPRFEIRDEDDQVAIELDRNLMGAGLYKIQLADQSLNPETIQALTNRRNYIFVDGPIKIRLSNGEYVVLTSDVLKSATMSKIALSEESRQRLIAARGGAHSLYQNKIDFGFKGDNAESLPTEYIVDFSFFGGTFEKLPWWRFAAKGSINSNKQDPLSEIRVYPFSVGEVFGLEHGRPFETGEVRMHLGIEGTQTFKYHRLNGSIYYTTLIPNLVDLTYGYQNRLRLLPVVKFGVEYWDELKDDANGGTLKKGGFFGGEIYYYIPVLDHYSLLLEGKWGIPLGGEFKSKNSVNDFIGQFDVTLGYELSDSDVKILAKYSFGQNNVNFVEDTRVLLGLAMNFLNIGDRSKSNGK